MQKFTKLTKPEEVDLFSIYEEDGKKYIHIYGYTWYDEDDDYDEDEDDEWDDIDDRGNPWHLQEYTWFIEELGEFIKHIKEDEDYVDHHAELLTQYIGDMKGDEMVDVINHYFNGECADAYLGFDQITMDTPCGDYC